MNFTNLPIDETPIHVVMWKDSTVISHTTHSNQEMVDLRRRVEELERIVQRLTVSQDKVKQSPFFKSTSVPEPIGMDIISKLTLDNESVNSSVIDSPIHVKEVFHNLIHENKKDKQVTLNGMNFTVRNFGSDVVYCEEMTGRAFLDPQDAFHNPTEKYIGYWNDKDETVSVRSEPFSEDDEQPHVKEEVVEPPKVEVVEEEEEQEEEEQELEEIEYKGNTYYKDSDNYVYEANEEGEVDTEKPIGIWIEEKQKVAKYKA